MYCCAMKDTVLILSGGMDSTTLLYDYQERIALLQATGKSNKKTRKTKWHYLFSLFLFVIIIDAYI